MEKPRSWFTARMAAAGAAEVFIFDEISPYWGTSSKTFAETVRGLNAKSLTVRLNSPGGSIQEGTAIYNFLKAESARGVSVRVEVDGWAASIASVIMLAGDTVTIGEGGFVMIHNPMNLAGGTAEELRKSADELDKYRDAILDIYEKETGQKRADISAWMDAETWFSAKEAVEKGFADSVTSGARAVACAAPRSLTFKHVPSSGVRIGNINPEQENMKEIAKLLGLPEDATQEQIVAKIQQERGDSKTKLDAVTAERDSLKASADAALASAAEVVVDAAIAKGQIKATARDAFIKSYKADAESTKALLDGIETPKDAAGATPPKGGRAPLPSAKAPGSAADPDAIAEQIKNCTDPKERVALVRKYTAAKNAAAAGK